MGVLDSASLGEMVAHVLDEPFGQRFGAIKFTKTPKC